MLSSFLSCFRQRSGGPELEVQGSAYIIDEAPQNTFTESTGDGQAPAVNEGGVEGSVPSSGSRSGVAEGAAMAPSSRRGEPGQPGQVVLPIATEVHECSPFELMEGLQLTRPLGQGTFGRVFKGTWHGTTVAIKLVVTPALNHIALKETHLGPQLQHPHVVQTYTTRCTRLTDDFFDHIEAHMDGRTRSWAVAAESAMRPGGVPGGGGAEGAVGASEAVAVDAGGVAVVMPPGTGAAAAVGGIHRHLRGLDGSGDGFGDPEAALRGDPQMALYGVLYSMQAAVGHWVTLAVMEFCDMQTLHAAITKGIFRVGHGWTVRVAQRALLRTATEVARGLLHLHTAGVVHGDVKPSNILLRSSRADRRGFTAKVSDFGAAHVLPADARSAHTSSWGTASYMAPEHLEAGRVSRATDVHSFGVVLWEMMSQRIPYAGMAQSQIAAGIVSGALQLDWPAEAPGPMAELVMLGQRCTSRDPAGRPGFQEVMLELVRIESALRNRAP